MSSPPKLELNRLSLKAGQVLNNRYRVLEYCNDGTFSNVYVCLDLNTQTKVAIKAFVNNEESKDSALKEFKIVKMLNSLDTHQNLFINIYNAFFYHRHACIVYELYGLSLYDVMHMRNDRPLPINAIKTIMYRVIQAVALIHKNGMVHTDIKLENILIPIGFDVEKGFNTTRAFTPAPSGFSSDSSDSHGISCTSYSPENDVALNVKLIDFGCMSSSYKWHHHLITTSHYRAPEVMLGIRWSNECDIWSLGCLLVELALGYIPFDAKDDVEHLFFIQHVISSYPEWMINECTIPKIQKSFYNGIINPSCLSREFIEESYNVKPMADILKFDLELRDLALQMLNPDPFERPNIEKIIEHPFFDSCI